MYVEHVRVLESLAISRHPVIPCGGLTLFEDIFDVSVQPASRLGTRESPEGRSRAANAVFDECGEKAEERSRKNGEGKEPKHLVWGLMRYERFIS